MVGHRQFFRKVLGLANAGRGDAGTDALMIFFVTFSQKHRYEPHPGGLKTHPDGYWTVTASSYGEALKLTRNTFGRFGFANVLNDKQFVKTSYSKGELGSLKSEQVHYTNGNHLMSSSSNGSFRVLSNGKSNGGSLKQNLSSHDDAKPALDARYKNGELTIRLDLKQMENVLRNHKDYLVTDVDKLGQYLAQNLLDKRNLDAIKMENTQTVFKQLLETCLDEAQREGAGLDFVGDDWMD